MVDLGLEMHITRLSTKLYRPQARSSQILRGRLVSRINQGFEPGVKMILLAAPVGFGKTSLLAEWISHGSIPVAWLSLDEADSDPTRFWDYVVAALRTIYPVFGEDMWRAVNELDKIGCATIDMQC